MSARGSARFKGEEETAQPIQPRIFSKETKVDLNNLMRRVKEEEKKNKRSNLVISAAVFSAVAVFGIILTL
jgi:hypothetical protein